MFPVGAAMGARAVASTYTALADTFCLQLPLAAMHELARDSAPFADFLNRRVQQFLALSQPRAAGRLRVAVAGRAVARNAAGRLVRPRPGRRRADHAAGRRPAAMHDKRIGSVLVLDERRRRGAGHPDPHDILGRVTLPDLPLGRRSPT